MTDLNSETNNIRQRLAEFNAFVNEQLAKIDARCAELNAQKTQVPVPALAPKSAPPAPVAAAAATAVPDPAKPKVAVAAKTPADAKSVASAAKATAPAAKAAAPTPAAPASASAPAPAPASTAASQAGGRKALDIKKKGVVEPPAPVPEPAVEEEAEGASEEGTEQAPGEEGEPEEGELPEEGTDTELVYIQLHSGNYFMDPETFDLYTAVSENEAAEEPCGVLKQVKAGTKHFFIDSTDNTMYHCLEGDVVGDKCGNLVNGKAVMDKKK